MVMVNILNTVGPTYKKQKLSPSPNMLLFPASSIREQKRLEGLKHSRKADVQSPIYFPLSFDLKNGWISFCSAF